MYAANFASLAIRYAGATVGATIGLCFGTYGAIVGMILGGFIVSVSAVFQTDKILKICDKKF